MTTAAATALVVGVTIGWIYGGRSASAAGRLPSVMTTAAIPTEPALRREPNRRAQPSPIAAGEITLPAPTVKTVALSFRPWSESDPDAPTPGRFDPGGAPALALSVETPEPRTPSGAAPRDQEMAEDADAAAPMERDRVFPQVTVVDGRTVQAGRLRIRLAGVALGREDEPCPMLDGTPDTCRNRAKTHLELFLRHRAIVCRLPEAASGVVEGRCRVGGSDVAAVIARVGLARAGAKADPIVIAGAAEAQRRKLGLWR